MILLNKSTSTQDIVLTLSELTTIPDAVYLLVLTSDFTQVVSRFILSGNTSLDTDRYDLFKLDTSLITSLEQGLYTYAAYQSPVFTYDETTLGKPIEYGKAKVIDPATVVQPIIYNSVPTEYVTYNSDND